MKYRVVGTLSVPVVTYVEADDQKDAQRIAGGLDQSDLEQLNSGDSETGWTFNDGFSIDIDEVERTE